MNREPTLYLIGLDSLRLWWARRRAVAAGFGGRAVEINLAAKPHATLAGRRIQPNDVAFTEDGQVSLDDLRRVWVSVVGHPG